MSFEKLNYSTANKVDWTIQDLIDSKSLDIKNLTAENLKELKVDIHNEKSHLNLRDIEWNIIWQLKENQKTLQFLWETISHNWKLFLKIKTQDWREWFVSADYVKGKIEKTVVAAVKKEIEEKNKKPKKLNKSLNNDWTVDTETKKPSFQVVWYTENWKNYIIWEDWEAVLLTHKDYSPEYKDFLKKYWETREKVINFNLLF